MVTTATGCEKGGARISGNKCVLFENERIRISEFILEADAGRVEIAHPYPTVRWQAANVEGPVEERAAVANLELAIKVLPGDTFVALKHEAMQDWQIPCVISAANTVLDNSSKWTRSTSHPEGSQLVVPNDGLLTAKSPTKRPKTSCPTENGTRPQEQATLASNDSDTAVGSHPMAGRFTVADKKVFWVDAGVTLSMENADSTKRVCRQLVFELLSQKPKFSFEEVALRLEGSLNYRGKFNHEQSFGEPADVADLENETRTSSEGGAAADVQLRAPSKYTTFVGTTLILENELCRVFDFHLQPSQGGSYNTVHHHTLDYTFVNPEPSRLLGYHHDMRPGLFDSCSARNRVVWNYIPEDAYLHPEKYSHGGKNGFGDKPMREFLVELK